MIGRAALFTAGIWLLCGGEAVAQAETGPTASAPRAGILSARATAHRQVANAVAIVSLGIEVHGRDVPTTLGPLAERSKTLLAYLQSQHVDRLGSDQVDLTPETQEQHGRPDRITGYAGRQTVTFQIDPAKLPSVAGDALAHGANTLQQVSLAPRDSDLETARRELAIEATRQAIMQIKAVADAADQRVAWLAEITIAPQDGGFRPPMPVPMLAPMLALKAAAPALPIEAGETEVSIEVAVKARILPKTPG